METSQLVTPELIAQFVDPDNEDVMVCEKVKKLKAFGAADAEDRIYIQTTHRIYTFK